MTARPQKGVLAFNTLFFFDTYFGRQRMNKVVGGLRRRNLDRLLAEAEKSAASNGRSAVDGGPVSSSGAGTTVPVTTLDSLTPEEFHRDYLKPMRPVVVKGLGNDCEAVGKWSPQFFKERYGDQPIMTVDGQDRTITDREAGVAEFHTAQMTVGEQVDLMLAGEPAYISFWMNLLAQNPELVEDLEVQKMQSYANPESWSPNPVYQFFMGGSRTSTGWHCDETQNLFLQIYGRKRWLMCAPAFTPYMDPRIVSLRSQYCHSMIDFREPDVEGYPLYGHVQLEEVVLDPGDVLYVPPFYWHCVENLEPSIGLAWWWYNLAAWRSHPLLFWLTVLSPQHLARIAWQTIRGEKPMASISSIFGAHDKS